MPLVSQVQYLLLVGANSKNTTNDNFFVLNTLNFDSLTTHMNKTVASKKILKLKNFVFWASYSSHKFPFWGNAHKATLSEKET